MALNSMTGFARTEGARTGFHWFWELRSVNGRGLDLRIRVPQGYGEVEVHARERLQAVLARGTVQASLQLQSSEQTPGVRINTDVLRALLEEAKRLHMEHDLEPPRIDGLLALRGVMELSEPELSSEERAAQLADLNSGFDTALEQLLNARRSEGQALERALFDHVSAIETLVGRAISSAARTPAAIRERLGQQLARIKDAGGQFDENRLHQEALLLAAKADIQEELDRLGAHIVAARELLSNGGTVGRKLDFLAQEFGRETNTLCAKAGDAELSVIGIELKSVVDQLREQVQNIE